MAQYSKYNMIYRLQKWMDSVAGQTFMNYAYSWGASVVILGTLFKLTHLPGANLMLFIGMGTEVFVFFISAFDRPFDKTQDGMEMETSRTRHEEAPVVAGGGPVVVGGLVGDAGSVTDGNTLMAGDAPVAAGGTIVIGGINGPTTPAPAVSQETAEEMETATKTYIERLSELNITLEKVGKMSQKLSVDSEEMENLNRTLTGIARVYEMQLKAASQQIGTQDEINARIKQMADQMSELNQIYARMIEAMTANIQK